MTAAHFSKQNSTWLAEFNSNLKIARGALAQPPASTSATSLYRNSVSSNNVNYSVTSRYKDQI